MGIMRNFSLFFLGGGACFPTNHTGRSFSSGWRWRLLRRLFRCPRQTVSLSFDLFASSSNTHGWSGCSFVLHIVFQNTREVDLHWSRSVPVEENNFCVFQNWSDLEDRKPEPCFQRDEHSYDTVIWHRSWIRISLFTLHVVWMTPVGIKQEECWRRFVHLLICFFPESSLLKNELLVVFHPQQTAGCRVWNAKVSELQTSRAQGNYCKHDVPKCS